MKLLIIGKAGSGKSTLSNYLVKKYNFKQFALGDNVKYFISDMTNILHNIDTNINEIKIEELFDVETKKKYRKHMQQIGTDLCQKWFGKTVWCEIINKQIKTNSINSNIIIDDCRFIHEYEYFKKQNYISIKILNNRCLLMNHSSELEQDLIEPDYIIENNNTIEDFYNKIDYLMTKLIKHNLN